MDYVVNLGLWADLDPRNVAAAALAALALAVLAAGASLWLKVSRQDRNRQVIDRLLAGRGGQSAPTQAEPQGTLGSAVHRAEQLGRHWGEGRSGNVLLPPEDRQVVDLCGFEDVGRARSLFMFARVLLTAGLPFLAGFLLQGRLLPANPAIEWTAAAFVGLALGWMLPKWMLLRRAARRRRAAYQELPLLIDLLRLLQGVGLSIDQSLHVVVTEFRQVMPVLARELQYAVDLYARGRTREQSLMRLATGFDNDDLSAICRLISQVDRHGGAVQDPLNRFGERVRERRRMELKERVGKLTVKMTGVMVLTLLPALLIVTGGAGFLAVIRGLSRVAGGS
ncbi:Type II/IV secretion system protein TadC, associated with Flp pilus assembly [plant metagenome]|uniref:Type II/IV secretion system protein TadC, associated with Flp pilus assembly n=1 Tax=plant metagenome TaxID=1297885 RepID=A0A484SSC1_9ZZZZ